MSTLAAKSPKEQPVWAARGPALAVRGDRSPVALAKVAVGYASLELGALGNEAASRFMAS